MSIIYLAENTVNHKCYIGKTKRTLAARKQRHLYDATASGSGIHFHRAIRKYGADAFEWVAIEEITDDEASDAERFWIAYYRSIGLALYNMTTGGDGGLTMPIEDHRARMAALHRGNTYRLGKPFSSEAKAKISAARQKQVSPMTGRSHSEEARAKMRSTHLGVPVSTEARAKISAALTGRRISDATKAKLSAARRATIARKAAKDPVNEL